MPSELDRRFDEILVQVTGPGGKLVIGEDEHGRAILTNFPATLPQFFRTFCALNAASEALVAGDERFTFADLDRISERLAHGLAAAGIGKGHRVGIAMRNCPAWILSYMAILKAGGIATLLNGWWEAQEMEHAVLLTDPKLMIADAPRATRIAARCPDRAIVTLPIELPAEQALAPLMTGADPLRAWGVGDDQRRIREPDRMLHLMRFPPAVEQGRDAAELDDRHVGQHPGRAIAHGDADAVALAYASGDKPMREPVGNCVQLGKGEALVARDQRLIGRIQRTEGLEELRKRRRKVVDDWPPLIVFADDEATAGAGGFGQQLIVTAVELASHSRSFAFAAPRLMRR